MRVDRTTPVFRVKRHTPGGIAEIAAVLDAIDPSALIQDLLAYRRDGGRKTFHPVVLWRAYLSSFLLGLGSTNALIRRLQDDTGLRDVCGFKGPLPHRTTFNRFITRLADHRERVEECMAQVTEHLKDMLPGLGESVAIDSTFVRSHANPHRQRKTGGPTDPEASWTAKTSARAKGGKDWSFGYKYHAVADATYGVLLYGCRRPETRLSGFCSTNGRPGPSWR